MATTRKFDTARGDRMGADFDTDRNCFQLVERPEPRRKGGSEPYKLGGLSSAEYKKSLKKFPGEDARKLREATAKNAWELVLGNLTVGKKRKRRKEFPRKEMGRRNRREWR